MLKYLVSQIQAVANLIILLNNTSLYLIVEQREYFPHLAQFTGLD